MLKLSSAVGVLSIGMLAATFSPALAQSREMPAGSSLASTPPIDQRAKQFRALPRTQKQFYRRQGYKRHQRPY